MSRFQILRRLRPSTVVPAVLVGALAVTGVSGLTETAHSPSGREVRLVDRDTPTDGMSYDMTSTGTSEVGRRYDAIIRDTRGRVRGTPLYGAITLTHNTNDYFPVTLAMGRSQITLVLTRGTCTSSADATTALTGTTSWAKVPPPTRGRGR